MSSIYPRSIQWGLEARYLCTADRQLADQLLTGHWVTHVRRSWGASIELDPHNVTQRLIRDWLRYRVNTGVEGNFTGEPAHYIPPPMSPGRPYRL